MFKRLLIVGLVIISLGILPLLSASSAQAQTGGFAIRAVSNLHVRAAPTTAAQILGTLPRGAVVTAVAATEGRSWLFVAEGGFGGWVSVAWIEVVNPTDSIYRLPLASNTNPINGTPALVRGSTTVNGRVIVASSVNVNMRTDPEVGGGAPSLAAGSREDNVIMVLPAGAQAEARAVSPMALWVLVRYNNVSGWVAGRYLNVVSGVLPGFPQFGVSPLTPDTIGAAQGTFNSDRQNIAVNECVVLSWNFPNAGTAFLDNDTVATVGSRLVCPSTMRTYTLAVSAGGATQSYQQTINVAGTSAGSPTTEVIVFTADLFQLAAAGQCTIVRWSTDGVREVYYQEQGVISPGERQECPTVTTNYTLRIVRRDGTSTSRTITITIPGTTPAGTTPGSTTFTPPDAGLYVVLTWNNDADLDLAVREPNGFTIDFNNRTSSTGGTFLQDANYPCGQNLTRLERISWPAGTASLSGLYSGTVTLFTSCGATTTPNWTATVYYNNAVIATQTGAGSGTFSFTRQ